MIHKLASAVYNNIVSGLSGTTSTPTISMEQIEADCVDERLQIIKEYAAKNIIPRKDLLVAINCIKTDCVSLDKCPGCNIANPYEQPQTHFQIPQVVNDSIEDTVEFIGSTDKNVQYKIYMDTSWQYHKYMRRGSEKPFVYIEPTPNGENMYDGWIFNAPFVKEISVIAIFKDPRQLEFYGCCPSDDTENLSFISAEIKKRLTEKYLRYYRSFYQVPTPNNQAPK